jgi:uncharacterized protein
VIVKYSVHALAVETFVPMLRSLSSVLDKAAQHAKAKGFEPTVLVQARLAPDMYAFVTQVQIACDYALNSTALLLGKPSPKVEHNERTLEQLQARIASTIAVLQSAPASAFEGAEDRAITLPLNNNLVLEMKGSQFLRDWALPHFYFHVVTAYDILRHNGVEIGKRDYLSHVGGSIRQRGDR